MTHKERAKVFVLATLKGLLVSMQNNPLSREAGQAAFETTCEFLEKEFQAVAEEERKACAQLADQCDCIDENSTQCGCSLILHAIRSRSNEEKKS